ncbi:MFS transporter [Streptacidiphilus pinicola]|uniref:MFS transporter n=1 Tax=Streptacidiphilus pinicola TaxID=2219663 RepID=A0A2X0IAG1_9ACTN|nr:MFS transporter [Streptacidiphilus pinicola]RAG80643.1 MFS transporter [Streptacidiphilus pinicola]
MSSHSQRQRTRLAVAILTGSAFLASLDLFIVNVAFDEIGRDFGTSSLGSLSWILNAYAVVYAALLVPMGRLSDRYGRKAGFVAGLLVFTLASLACGFAPGVWWLVTFRVVQAVGAALMTPASLGLLLATLPAQRRAGGARLWAMTGAVAAAFGPAVGGGLVQISWQTAFWINVPIGLGLTFAAVKVVPDVRHNTEAPRPDLLGGAVIAVATGALVLGLVQGNDWGWSSGRVLAAWALAVVGLAVFVRLITHHDAPVIDPALLRIPSFAWANIAQLLFNVAFGIGLLSRVLWLQEHWGYSAVRTGLAVAVGPALVPITSLLVTRLLPRAAPGRVVALGCLLLAAGALWQATATGDQPAYATQMLGPWVVSGIAVGLALPQLTAAATAALPPHQASTGSGVVNMARQLGLVVGTSIMVGLLGAGLPSLARFQHVWVFMAASAAAAAVAALVMGAVRGPAVALQRSADVGRATAESSDPQPSSGRPTA